jgi:hypothetical protein
MYTNRYFRLPPGRFFLARPAIQHTESKSFKHTVTTFKYTNWYFILPPWPRGLARPPHIYINVVTILYIYRIKPDTKI